MMRNLAFDIVIAGAGPAGLAAAHAAAGSGLRIAVVDDNPSPGGQIWRGGPRQAGDARAAELWEAVSKASNITFLSKTKICAPLDHRSLLAESPLGPSRLRYERLILATGARERLLPFPGWTLPGVTGAGGLQALSKGGYPVADKRVVVAGSGPLLLAVAASLKSKGAQILAILEQARLPALAGFAWSLLRVPDKLGQALQLRGTLLDVPYCADSYVLAAEGSERLHKVIWKHGHRRKALECDYLACGYGLLPNMELAVALGCATTHAGVQVDALQATTLPNIYCAGEASGIGGVDLALVEGRIAGHAAAGAGAQAAALLPQRARWRAFGQGLAHAFSLRQELRQLCDKDTIVCRCEDVAHGELAQHQNWRSAKLQTRCGMGPCQGRVCGAATDFLYGWTQDSVRVPLAPTRIASLATSDDARVSVSATRSDSRSE